LPTTGGEHLSLLIVAAFPRIGYFIEPENKSNGEISRSNRRDKFSMIRSQRYDCVVAGPEVSGPQETPPGRRGSAQTPRTVFFPGGEADFFERAVAAIVLDLFGHYATHHGWT
jgi:hypothetical protein